MPSIINRTLSVAMLFWITFAWNLGSCATASLPRLENRVLRISRSIAGLEYQYEVCKKRILGICVDFEMKKELYDLNNLETRKQLADMGFIAVVEDKP